MDNRIIKFRFWTPDKVMLDDHEGWIENIGINEALQCSASYGYKIMQYTGLKDSKGVEIYEGDILLCDWCFKKMPSRGYISKKSPKLIKGYALVKWDTGRFIFEFIETIPEHKYFYEKNKQQYAYIGYSLDNYSNEQDHVTVIGNIYQNPSPKEEVDKLIDSDPDDVAIAFPYKKLNDE